MLDNLTILKYARKGAMNEYESARTIYALLPCAETAALVKDCEGTASAIEAIYLKEKHKQHPANVDMANKLAEEAARKRTVSAGRFVQAEPDCWAVCTNYKDGSNRSEIFRNETRAREHYENIRLIDKSSKVGILSYMSLTRNGIVVKSYERS